jgi:hypothetical protein
MNTELIGGGSVFGANRYYLGGSQEAFATKLAKA